MKMQLVGYSKWEEISLPSVVSCLWVGFWSIRFGLQEGSISPLSVFTCCVSCVAIETCKLLGTAITSPSFSTLPSAVCVERGATWLHLSSWPVGWPQGSGLKAVRLESCLEVPAHQTADSSSAPTLPSWDLVCAPVVRQRLSEVWLRHDGRVEIP